MCFRLPRTRRPHAGKASASRRQHCFTREGLIQELFLPHFCLPIRAAAYDEIPDDGHHASEDDQAFRFSIEMADMLAKAVKSDEWKDVGKIARMGGLKVVASRFEQGKFRSEATASHKVGARRTYWFNRCVCSIILLSASADDNEMTYELHQGAHLSFTLSGFMIFPPRPVITKTVYQELLKGNTAFLGDEGMVLPIEIITTMVRTGLTELKVDCEKITVGGEALVDAWLPMEDLATHVGRTLTRRVSESTF